MSKNIEKSVIEMLSQIDDPNEFIAAARRTAAEENRLSAAEMFPLPEDARGDVILSFIGIWLTMNADLPVNDKQQLVTATKMMIESIEKIRELFSDDPERFESELLECLRRSIAPRIWEI